MLLSEDENKVVYECANYTSTVGNLLSSLICVSILNTIFENYFLVRSELEE